MRIALIHCRTDGSRIAKNNHDHEEHSNVSCMMTCCNETDNMICQILSTWNGHDRKLSLSLENDIL